MVDTFGFDISNAFNYGEEVKEIYSNGVLVWSKSTPGGKDGYLCVQAQNDTTFTIRCYGFTTVTTTPEFQYSNNGYKWIDLKHYQGSGEIYFDSIDLKEGDKIYIKGVNEYIAKVASYSTYSIDCYTRFTFGTGGKYSISGNIMSLLYGDDYKDKVDLTDKNYAFRRLFTGTGVTDASNLNLPATTLSPYCYQYMFQGCSILTNSPELPATSAASYCYNSMFYGCTNLTSAPELPATTLNSHCYDSMFCGCAGLATAPYLPATKLKGYCYQNMFNGCTSLNYVKAYFVTTPSSSYTYNWLSGVSSTGTFVAKPTATWPSSITRSTTTVPSGWTIITE